MQSVLAKAQNKKITLCTYLKLEVYLSKPNEI